MRQHSNRVERIAKYALWTGIAWIGVASIIALFDQPKIVTIGQTKPTPIDRSKIPPEMADAPDIQIQEYDVEGRTPKEIVNSLWAKSIQVEGQGPAAAVTHSHLKFNLGSVTVAGRCQAANPVAQTRFRVELPRHETAGTPPDMQVRWHAFRRALEMHEAEHVHITLKYAARIRAAIIGRSCDDAHRIIDQLGEEMKREDMALDDRGCTAFERGDGSKAALIECPHVLLYELFGWRD